MQEKIKEILSNHYKNILEELEEVVNTDELELFLEIKHDDFKCKLGG